MSLGHGATIVRDGLVLYLDAANEKSYPGSGTTWSDLSGNGNNGTLVNGPTYSTSDQGYFTFDGTNDYASATPPVPGTSDFTVTVWVYTFNNTSNDYVWDFGSNGGTLSMGTSIGNYGFRYYNGYANSPLYTSGLVPNINRWYNVVISRNNYTTSMYVDASFITSDTGDTRAINGTFHIGRYGGATGYELDGRLSNIAIYNKALSAAEITQNFEATRGRFGI